MEDYPSVEQARSLMVEQAALDEQVISSQRSNPSSNLTDSRNILPSFQEEQIGDNFDFSLDPWDNLDSDTTNTGPVVDILTCEGFNLDHFLDAERSFELFDFDSVFDLSCLEPLESTGQLDFIGDVRTTLESISTQSLTENSTSSVPMNSKDSNL